MLFSDLNLVTITSIDIVITKVTLSLFHAIVPKEPHMNKMRVLPIFIGLALSTLPCTSWAAGFQLNTQSATGLGRAFAGDGVIADNASVISRNPAGMALLHGTQISTGLTFINTQINVKEGQLSLFQRPLSGINQHLAASNLGGDAYAPNVYLTMPINTQWTWGMSAYSNFGTTTQFDDDYLAPTFGGLTSIHSANFGLSLAYKLNRHWSFGGGLDYVYGVGKIQRHMLPEQITQNNPLLTAINKKAGINVDAKGGGIGFNFGVIYQYNANNRWGLSYRYSPTIKAHGTVDALFKSADSIEIPLPDMLEFSGYHRFNPKWAAVYSLQWVGWSHFESLNFAGIKKPYNWKDGGHISIGGLYTLNPEWTLRAGYMFDIAATDHVKSIAIPDSNRQWLSAGATYHWTPNSSVDFGATYLMGKDEKITEPFSSNSPISMTAITRADAWLFGLQYNHRFA
jgi:long-chain fatty acid transport protein